MWYKFQIRTNIICKKNQTMSIPFEATSKRIFARSCPQHCVPGKWFFKKVQQNEVLAMRSPKGDHQKGVSKRRSPLIRKAFNKFEMIIVYCHIRRYLGGDPIVCFKTITLTPPLMMSIDMFHESDDIKR